MRFKTALITAAMLTVTGAQAMAGCANAQIVLEKGQPTPLIHAFEVSVHAGGRLATGDYVGILDSPFHFGGRYQWPGAYFEGRFNATDIFFETDDSANILRVLIDGQSVGTLNRPGQDQYRVRGLSKGEHIIRIEKLTETQGSTGAFHGFAVNPDGKELPAPAPRTRQVEFIGDSYTAGYGNTSPKRECTKDEIWATTDTQQAFGPLTAKHYNADYQINAYSGIGIVRNYDGVAPGHVMPKLYRYNIFDQGDGKDNLVDTATVQNDWNPQIVVIALGGNDFSTPVHAGDKWKTIEDLRADYIASYIAFVQQVRATHPKAQFVLLSYGEDEITKDIAAVMDGLKVAGETRVAFFDVGGDFEKTGCDWHLNTNDDLKISQRLTGYIDAHPDLWASQ